MSITVKRGDELLSMTVIPEQSQIQNEFGQDVEATIIGILDAGKFKTGELGPLSAARKSIQETWRWIELTFRVIIKLFQGVVPFKSLGGPILIGQMAGQLAQDNLGNLIPFMAVISINLGILNLLPIPILDGGLIIFLVLELLIGKPLSLKKREMAMKVGLALLVLLMALVTYNDISRIIEKVLG